MDQRGTRVATWVPPEEKDPVVLQEPSREHITIIGAVRPKDGTFIAEMVSTANWEIVRVFLEGVLELLEPGKKAVVVLDNAKSHHAKALNPWLEEVKDLLELKFLPPYSPMLNPIERVWKLLRRLVTHNCYWPQLQLLYDAILKQFERWSEPNEQLKKLCVV